MYSTQGIPRATALLRWWTSRKSPGCRVELLDESWQTKRTMNIQRERERDIHIYIYDIYINIHIDIDR